MSHPNPPGNGCSLEDCFTNLFALTDVCGIKWRRLTVESVAVDPLDDPVLISYWKCIQEDILCVWRRVLRNADHRGPEQMSFSKELWVFWYGDLPAKLSDLLSPDLREVESGSWEKDDKDKDKVKEIGLSYECRTLLFKALHNLIERCLLSKNFVRLGKWFILPHDQANMSSERSTHLSFSFNFFLHGESTVCASIEVKQRPPVWRLSHHHLTIAQSNQSNLQVILAPFGQNGMLTGHVYRDTDQQTNRLFDEWKQCYPVESLEPAEANGDAPKLPAMVEVIVGGFRMRHPSKYVCIVDMDEGLARAPTVPNPGGLSAAPRIQYSQPVTPGAPLTPPTSPGDPHFGVDPNVKVLASNMTSGFDIGCRMTEQSANALGYKITEKVCQDCCITTGIAKRSDNTNDDLSAASWDFSEPTARTSCSCLRYRHAKAKSSAMSLNKGGMPGSGKHNKGDKPDKSDRQQSRHGQTSAFHRRMPQFSDECLQYSMDMMIPRGPNPAFRPEPTSMLGNNSVETSVESPSSAAPSPLDEPRSQPIVGQNLDPMMPTLSPHPPPKLPGDKELSSKAANSESQSANGMVNGPREVFAKPGETNPRTEPVISSFQQSQATDVKKHENINSWLRLQHKQMDVQCRKRPMLPSPTFESSELVTDSLYNFRSLNTWLEFPIKKTRLDPKHDSHSASHHGACPDGGPKLAHKTPMQQHHSAPDIYEFSDESSINPGTLAGRGYRNSREEGFSRSSSFQKDEDFKDLSTISAEQYLFAEGKQDPDLPSSTTMGSSLKSVKDLEPSLNDLNQLFDTDEDSDDGVFQNQGMIGIKQEDPLRAGRISNLAMNGVGETVPDPLELSKMYPTPPSMENIPSDGHSPQTSAEPLCETTIMDSVYVKMEVQPTIMSQDPSKDWSFVFKLQNHAKFVGSTKYTPVELPSGQISPCTSPPEYKASWQFALPNIEKHQPPPSHYINVPSVENIPSLSRMQTAIESSPATFHGSVQQRTPISSLEPQSPPLSNSSSCLNRTLNSIDNQGTNHQLPEAHSLVVNVILSDSLLNVFKDHNFDSCNICVCNMNIKGSDIGMFLPDTSAIREYQDRCSCGFSAVMNRRHGHNAGLFYEDEVEITGIKHSRYDTRKPSLLELGKSDGKMLPPSVEEDVPLALLDLLLGQFIAPYPSSVATNQRTGLMFNLAVTGGGNSGLDVQMGDENEVTYLALEQGRQAMEICSPIKLDDHSLKGTCLHKWPYLQGGNQSPSNSHDVVRLLKSLQPLLQDAIQKKRTTKLWEHAYKLSGPLSWKDFHQLAGRGSDENCEPQPIPYFLAGYDRDWMSVSPYAIGFWDKLFMEPYGKPRNVGYVVVSPDNDYVLSNAKQFFRELSTVYEQCRMGQHCPVSFLSDGFLEVGRTTAQKYADEQMDDWFTQLGDSPEAAKLRLYARACRHHLGPLLSEQPLDKTLFKSSSSSSQQSAYRPPAPSPAHLDNQSGSTGQDDKDTLTDSQNHIKEMLSHDTLDSSDGADCPALVVYIIDPFTYGKEWDELSRLAMVGLLRCYQQMIAHLPEHLCNNIMLQIVPMKMVVDNTDTGTYFQFLKSMAFSVFTSCRWNLTHTVRGHSLTGFGPASAEQRLLKNQEPGHAGTVRLYSPPFVLAPMKTKQLQLAESCGKDPEVSNTLFCAYCLSEDQRWLLATCTDERGEMMETCTINIEIPNRNRRKKASARKAGLRKLWDFIVGVISMANLPARLVIGRFGRLGHGELLGWASILGKKNLQHTGLQLRDMCRQCNVLGGGDMPSILSACLVSIEPQSSFQVMADAVKNEERMSSSSTLQTPRDASCTHILVFPVSATAQANTNPLHQDAQIDLPSMNTQFDFTFPDDDELNVMDIGGDDMLAILLSGPSGEGNGTPPYSPTMMDGGRQSASKMMGPANPSLVEDPQNDIEVNLLQQPLAMGYYVSTAQPGPLPKWFWSACPDAENSTPSVFKAALHIHSNQDEYIHMTHNRNTHPLDSSLTCDVLRFVLENYNALSWLSMDPATNDRRSCLPLHVVVLMQMYHAMNAFV